MQDWAHRQIRKPASKELFRNSTGRIERRTADSCNKEERYSNDYLQQLP